MLTITNVYDPNETPGLVQASAFTPDKLIAGQANLVTMPGTLAAGTLSRGTVLGQVTATGYFVQCLKTANDGSQTPRAILVDDCDASAGIAKCNVYVSGEFRSEALTYHASWTLATLQMVCLAVGINLKTTNAALSTADAT
jgi:hypothetical protein